MHYIASNITGPEIEDIIHNTEEAVKQIKEQIVGPLQAYITNEKQNNIQTFSQTLMNYLQLSLYFQISRKKVFKETARNLSLWLTPVPDLNSPEVWLNLFFYFGRLFMVVI